MACPPFGGRLGGDENTSCGVARSVEYADPHPDQRFAVHKGAAPTLRFSDPGKGWLSNSRKIRKSLFSAIFRVLYQRAYALTVAQWRWAIDRIRSGSSIRKRQAFAHAATISS